MFAKKVDILGIKYAIKHETEATNPKLENANGICEWWSHELILNSIPETKETFKDLDEFKKKVLRHEITHAAFHESGLDNYGGDETLVNWIALQIPKLAKAMQEAGCL